MRQSFLKLCMLAISFFFFISCEKEVKDTNITSGISSDVKAENGNKIRLTSVVNDFITQTFSYNSEGLMNVWHYTGIDFTVNAEYDEFGRMAKSLVYFGSTLTYTVYFFYENNHVVKEIWYNGSTNDISDEVFYTYDPDGSMLRIESFIQNYYAVYQYTSNHQLAVNTIYQGGMPLVRYDYTYLANYRNPFDAIPGLTYAFIFADGVLYTNKFWYTSLSATFYDETGNILFEDLQDPDATTNEAGPDHYPATSSFYDKSFDNYLNYVFTYENCGSCATGKTGITSDNTNSLKHSLNTFMLRDPKHPMKEKAADLRMAVRKFKDTNL